MALTDSIRDPRKNDANDYVKPTSKPRSRITHADEADRNYVQPEETNTNPKLSLSDLIDRLTGGNGTQDIGDSPFSQPYSETPASVRDWEKNEYEKQKTEKKGNNIVEGATTQLDTTIQNPVVEEQKVEPTTEDLFVNNTPTYNANDSLSLADSANVTSEVGNGKTYVDLTNGKNEDDDETITLPIPLGKPSDFVIYDPTTDEYLNREMPKPVTKDTPKTPYQPSYGNPYGQYIPSRAVKIPERNNAPTSSVPLYNGTNTTLNTSSFDETENRKPLDLTPEEISLAETIGRNPAASYLGSHSKNTTPPYSSPYYLGWDTKDIFEDPTVQFNDMFRKYKALGFDESVAYDKAQDAINAMMVGGEEPPYIIENLDFINQINQKGLKFADKVSEDMAKELGIPYYKPGEDDLRFINEVVLENLHERERVNRITAKEDQLDPNFFDPRDGKTSAELYDEYIDKMIANAKEPDRKDFKTDAEYQQALQTYKEKLLTTLNRYNNRGIGNIIDGDGNPYTGDYNPLANGLVINDDFADLLAPTRGNSLGRIDKETGLLDTFIDDYDERLVPTIELTLEEFEHKFDSFIEANPRIKALYDKGILTADDIADFFFKNIKISDADLKTPYSGYGRGYGGYGWGGGGWGGGGGSSSTPNAKATDQRDIRVHNILKNWTF